MSTSTSRPQHTQTEEGAVVSTVGRTLQGWLIVLLVFVAGATSLAVEMAASRLLAPYFGSSLFVWANLIGLILLYLTLGYYLGGRLADRYPRPAALYWLTIIASLLIGVIPLLSRPILNWALNAFATYSISEFYGSLVSVILLFAIPMILLGCVSPYAIRLRVEQVGKSGRISGQLYAISTAGSIVGTFLPVLVLIPNIGTYCTFIAFAIALLLVSLIGMFVARRASGQPPKLRLRKDVLTLLLLVPVLFTLTSFHGPIKPAGGTGNGGTLITERESTYNYIQVVRVGEERQLILNEGIGVHSIYNPAQVLTNGPWDYFLIAPYFNNAPFSPDRVRSVCVIGLGAGTIPRELNAAYGPLTIDGVEIDGEIVNLARQYFDMNEPNMHVAVQDGRNFMRTTSKHYDIIGIDAYQQPYVPFQMTTSEFFHEVRTHLTPTGVAVINAGRTATDFRLVTALAQTMHTVFPNVYIIDSTRFANSLVIGTNAPTSLNNFFNNTANLQNPLLQAVARNSLLYGNVREEPVKKVYFTDDRAPVEQLIDSIIFNEVESVKR